MNYAKIRESLIKHEGEVLHAYEDHLGYLTIGVGRLIDKRRGGGISHNEAMLLLNNDISRVVADLEDRCELYSFPEPVQHALVEMGFQLGVNGLMNFKKMWQHLRNHDYFSAADEALDSRWAQQTPNRANAVADMLRGAG